MKRLMYAMAAAATIIPKRDLRSILVDEIELKLLSVQTNRLLLPSAPHTLPNLLMCISLLLYITPLSVSHFPPTRSTLSLGPML